MFSGHEWLQFECRAKRDILEAMNDRNTLTLQGENWISLIDYNMTKEGYFFLSYETFEYFFEGAWKSLQGRGKSPSSLREKYFSHCLEDFSPYLEDFSRHLHSSENSSKKVRKGFVGQGKYFFSMLQTESSSTLAMLAW